MKYNLTALGARSLCGIALATVFTSSTYVWMVMHVDAQTPEVGSAQLSCSDVRGPEGLSLAVPKQNGLVTEPGAHFSVPVTIGNSYEYELRGLSIGVVVFFDGNPIPYDWFNVTTDVQVAPLSDKVVNATWTVPHNAPAGSYEFAVFVHQGDSQSLLTNALSRNSLSDNLSFTVSGQAQPGARFDANSITVNDKPTTAGAINTFPADAEHLEFSIDLVNGVEDAPQVGTVTFTVYESFYPHSLSELETKAFEARLLSDSRNTYALDFAPNFDQYIITGQFKAEDGSQSSFLLLLQREGATGTITQPMPVVSFIGVAPKSEEESEIITCIQNNESALLRREELAPGYPVSYRLSVHPFDASGNPVRSESMESSAGEGELGGGYADLGFVTKLERSDEFMVRVELLKEGEVVHVREVSYQCHPDFGCAVSPAYFGLDDSNIFGIGMGVIVRGMRLATLAILITVIAIFFCNIYPLVMRKRKPAVIETKQGAKSV